MNAERESSQTWKIAIVGAGLSGRLAALALLRQGFEVALYDVGQLHLAAPGGPAARPDPRTTALSPPSVELLIDLDLWDQLEAMAQPVGTMMVGSGESLARAWQNPQNMLRLSHQDTPHPALVHIVKNRDLGQVIDQALARQSGLSLHGQAGDILLEEAGSQVVVRAANEGSGASLSYDLVIGADGRNSMIQKRYFDNRALRLDYQQAAFVCELVHRQPLGELAVQVFLPQGPLALLPLMPDEQGLARTSLIWSAQTDFAQALTGLDREALKARLQERLGGILGHVEQVDAVGSFPLQAHLASQFVKDRMVIIGDAAHGIHPLAGQGLNLAIGDIESLARHLLNARLLGLELNPALVLAEFERERRAHAKRLLAVTDGLNRLFSGGPGLLRQLAGAAMSAVGQLPGGGANIIRLALN